MTGAIRAHLPDKHDYAVATRLRLAPAPPADEPPAPEPPPVIPAAIQAPLPATAFPTDVRMLCNGRDCLHLIFYSSTALVQHVIDHREDAGCGGDASACNPTR